MPYGEDRDGISVDAVAGQVAAIAEVDDPLTELVGHVLDGAADARLLPQHRDALADGLYRPLGSIQVLVGQEATERLHIEQCRLRPDQT